MFSRFCGFGPGHKSTRHVTKVFRDDIKEAFGQGHGKDNMGDILESTQPDHHPLEHVDENEFKDDWELDDDGDLEEDGEDGEEDLWGHGDELDELGYAPL